VIDVDPLSSIIGFWGYNSAQYVLNQNPQTKSSNIIDTAGGAVVGGAIESAQKVDEVIDETKQTFVFIGLGMFFILILALVKK
jgi:hypothetical protein